MDKKFEMAVRSYAEAINIIKHHQWQYEVTMACPGPSRLKNNRWHRPGLFERWIMLSTG